MDVDKKDFPPGLCVYVPAYAPRAEQKINAYIVVSTASSVTRLIASALLPLLCVFACKGTSAATSVWGVVAVVLSVGRVVCM